MGINFIIIWAWCNKYVKIFIYEKVFGLDKEQLDSLKYSWSLDLQYSFWRRNEGLV